jgi:hypothetical protein
MCESSIEAKQQNSSLLTISTTQWPKPMASEISDPWLTGPIVAPAKGHNLSERFGLPMKSNQPSMILANPLNLMQRRYAMNQTIDAIKLKAAAEHLEWVLRQYPDNDDVRSLLNGLLPLIEDAKAGRILGPVDRADVPGAYSFADGLYTPYKDPDVGDAYASFRIEIGGGLTEQGKQRHARMEAMRKAIEEDADHE